MANRRGKRTTSARKGGALTKADESVLAGKTPPAVRAIEVGERNKAIYRDWRRHKPPSLIAEEHGLKVRQVQNIVDQCRAASVEAMPSTGPLIGLKLTDEHMDQIEEGLAWAAEVTELAQEDKNWNAAVAGLKRMADGRRELLVLQQAKGLVPRNIAELHATWDAIDAGAQIIDILFAADIPRKVMDEIANALRLPLREDRERLELDLRTMPPATDAPQIPPA